MLRCRRSFSPRRIQCTAPRPSPRREPASMSSARSRSRCAQPTLDALVAMYRFASGLSGTLATVRATPFYWRVHVFGSSGSAEVLGETELVLRMSGRPAERLAFAPEDSVKAELEAFADAVEQRAPYPIPVDEMLATVSAFEATVRSLRASRRASSRTRHTRRTPGPRPSPRPGRTRTRPTDP